MPAAVFAFVQHQNSDFEWVNGSYESCATQHGKCTDIGQLKYKSSQVQEGSLASTPCVVLATGEECSLLFVSKDDPFSIEVWKIVVGIEDSFSEYLGSIQCPPTDIRPRLACKTLARSSAGVLACMLWASYPEHSCIHSLKVTLDSDSAVTVTTWDRLQHPGLYRPTAIAVSAHIPTTLAVVDAASGSIHIFKDRGKLEHLHQVENEHTRLLSKNSFACFDSKSSLWASDFTTDTLLKSSTDFETQVFPTHQGVEGLAANVCDSHLVVGCLTKDNRTVEIKCDVSTYETKEIIPPFIGVVSPLFVASDANKSLFVVSGRSRANNSPEIGFFQV